MIRSTKWFMSVLPFSLIYSLDQLLLLCLLLPFVREVMARQTGLRARAPLVAVAEVRRGAKGVDLLLQVKAQVPIVLLAKSGWLASVNVLCVCFGIKESATWRIASTSTCAVWLPMASPAWVITGLMSTRPLLIEGARRIIRRFLRAVMVSLASCFRFLPLHLLQCLRHQLVPHTLRLRVIFLKEARLAGAQRFPGLLQEFLLFLGWNHRGLFQTCLLQCLLLLGRDSFFWIFVVEPLARFLRRPFVTSWHASVWTFFWTLPMTCFRTFSTSPCCDGASVAFLFLHWQVHLVVISVGQSFAPEALSPCELQSFLLGFLVFQIGTSSA